VGHVEDRPPFQCAGERGDHPEYLGVGYIIRAEIAGNLVRVVSSRYLVLIPADLLVGENLPAALRPGVGNTLIPHVAGQIRLGYVRYIGAGAVAAAGLITLIRTLPTIVSAVQREFRQPQGHRGREGQLRTERDMPITWVIVGSLVLGLIVALFAAAPGTLAGRLFMGLLVVVFGFFS